MEPCDSTARSLFSRGSVSNALILERPSVVDADECCASLLEPETGEVLGVIGVTFSLTPDQWVTNTTAALSAVPRHMTVVSVGEQSRSSTPQTRDHSRLLLPESDTRCDLKSVSSPGNLTTLGVRITECVDEVFSNERVTNVSLCFRSISPLFLNAEASTVFQFLQVLTGMLRAEGVLAHYHLNPNTHDDQEIERLKVLFDATAEVTEDGLVVTHDRPIAGCKQGPRTWASETTEDRAVILVVEDDPDLGPLLVDWLAEDHIVRLAESCAKAIELVDEEIDVALLDRTLPDGTGTDVLDAIHTKGIDCRVAMLTAMPMECGASESHFDEYLEKPIYGDDLRRTVIELLDR